MTEPSSIESEHATLEVLNRTEFFGDSRVSVTQGGMRPEQE